LIAASSAAIHAARSPKSARPPSQAAGTVRIAKATESAWVSASPLPKTLVHSLRIK
jgi:hypothetical protein